jgi:hypothetical protein
MRIGTQNLTNSFSSDWAIGYRQFWEESSDKLDAVVNQMKKAEVGHDKKHVE